jgi:hypothetical protein
MAALPTAATATATAFPVSATVPAPAAGDVPDCVMDEVHLGVWQAVRHLFPAEAVATEPKPGWISITWSIAPDSDSSQSFATPILLKIEHPLLKVMWTTSTERRKAIATRQEATVRTGMLGYNPNASLPDIRVVVLG